MWICFNDAFVSAVEDERDKTKLKVRARKREHLATLFPGETIYESNVADYAFRTFVTKEAFAKLVSERINDISYGNFKDSVKDDDLHALYHEFWNLHWRYQEMPMRRRRKQKRAADLFEYAAEKKRKWVSDLFPSEADATVEKRKRGSKR